MFHVSSRVCVIPRQCLAAKHHVCVLCELIGCYLSSLHSIAQDLSSLRPCIAAWPRLKRCNKHDCWRTCACKTKTMDRAPVESSKSRNHLYSVDVAVGLYAGDLCQGVSPRKGPLLINLCFISCLRQPDLRIDHMSLHHFLRSLRIITVTDMMC